MTITHVALCSHIPASVLLCFGHFCFLNANLVCCGLLLWQIVNAKKKKRNIFILNSHCFAGGNKKSPKSLQCFVGFKEIVYSQISEWKNPFILI